MKVYQNPLFDKQGSPNTSLHNSLNDSSSSKPSVNDIINKYEKKNMSQGGFEQESIKSSDTIERALEINDLEDANVSQLLGQLSLETDENEKSYNFGLKSATNKDVSGVEIDLFDEMSTLKDRIFGFLQNYQTSLTTKNPDNSIKIKQKIKQDAKTIKHEYDFILDKFNRSVDISSLSMDQTQNLQDPKNGEQMNNMFNLVEEFLDKFQGRKPTQNLYTKLLEEKLQNSSMLDQSQQRSSHYDFQYTEESECSINITNTNDTFYNHKENIDIKINDIKAVLTDMLKDQTYSQSIILETIDSIQEVIKTQEIDYIRKVMKKIEIQLSIIKKEKATTPSTMKLYSLLQQSLNYMEEKQEDILNNSQINTSQPTQDPQLRRRKFFDEALKVKADLPQDHPGKKVLVSVLYEQAQQEGIPEGQWTQWIKEQMQK